MINVREGLEICKDILEKGDINFLAVEAAEILLKHRDGEKISRVERFIIGLAYSEFYTNDSSDEGYYRAEIKRQNFLKILGLNGGDFVEKLESML